MQLCARKNIIYNLHSIKVNSNRQDAITGKSFFINIQSKQDKDKNI